MPSRHLNDAGRYATKVFQKTLARIWTTGAQHAAINLSQAHKIALTFSHLNSSHHVLISRKKLKNLNPTKFTNKIIKNKDQTGKFPFFENLFDYN